MSYLYSHKRKVDFDWFEDNGTCACTITTNFGKFHGFAFCHFDDLDMKSQRTGEQISYSKAIIEMLKHERDYILKPQVIALEHVMSIINMKKETADSSSHAAITLKRQLRNLKWELEIVRDNIDHERESLREYIDEKEKMYQKIRSKTDKNQPSKNNI